MEFLIALGLGIFLIIIVFKEAFKSSKSDDKFKLVSGTKDYIIGKYTNLIREKELRAYVEERQNETEIYEALKDDLTYIFGDDYKNKYSLFPNPLVPEMGMIDKIEQKIAIHLLLSHEGLVSYWNVYDGYYIINNPNNNLVGIYLMRAAQRIEYNLRQIHNDDNLTLWYKPDQIENSGGKLKIVNSWTRGYFYWKWTWTCDNKDVVRAWSESGTCVFIGYLFSLIPQPNNKDWWWFKYE